MEIDPNLRSVVAVRAHIPENAFTASGLGTLREGSGVVIGDKGLVLTIGYLITEAEEVWLTRQDGIVVAGHALAYDQETGFGLVQALGALDLPAIELGDSSKAELGDAVTFADGTKPTVDQMARDVSAFLVWTAEPKLEARHVAGAATVVFLLVFCFLAWGAYQNVWRDVQH